MASACPICTGNTSAIDVLDLSKSCGVSGEFLPLTFVPVYYFICDDCDFVFAPELYGWSKEQFKDLIYNEEYIQVDPEYVEVRPTANATMINRIFGDQKTRVKHLDFGGGNGHLSSQLSSWGWNSSSYDPFEKDETDADDLGQFDFVTAFEVFEHVPDPNALIEELSTLTHHGSLIFFSTLLSDGEITRNERLTWWYCAPRNGHISLYSRKSLYLLGKNHGLNYGNINQGTHILFKEMPEWAAAKFTPST